MHNSPTVYAMVIFLWLCSIIEISLLNDAVYIAVVEYKIGDMGFIRYYLAPKIEDGDDAS